MKTTIITIVAIMALACAAKAQVWNEFGLGGGNNSLTGSNNTAIGYFALRYITSGSDNTASGSAALLLNTTGNANTAYGDNALLHNTTGDNNIGLGDFAGSNLTTGDNNIDIGNVGVAGEAATVRIGAQGTHTKTFIAGINGTSVAGGSLVVVSPDGQLGTAPTGTGMCKGACLTVPSGTAAPAGYTLLGTTSMKYKVGKKTKTMNLDLYQKD